MSRPASLLTHVAFFCAFAIPIIKPAIAAEPPPNIVFILSDDQGWGDFGFMGHPHIQTPNLDLMARQSLVFHRGYVPDSLCRASLATIISGMYPCQHKIVGNDPKVPDDWKGVPGAKIMTDPRYIKLREQYIAHIDQVNTLPKRLNELGYQSLQTGKWWEGNFRRGGFDEGMTHGDMARGARHGDGGLRIGRQGLEPIEKFVAQSVQQSTPFFVWYAPMMPHTPHDPPKRLLDKYIDKTPHLPVAKYWAMCEWFDETIGELRQILERNHAAENTAIVFVCDNGWINETQASQYAPRSKRTPYEGGVRTPIMIHWPKKIAPRIDTTHLVSSIDLVPTAMHVAGLPITPELPGCNLLDESAVANRQSIFGEIYDHDAASIDDPAPSLRYRWVIEKDWKLIQHIPLPKTPSPKTPDTSDSNAEPIPEQSTANRTAVNSNALAARLELYNLSQDPTEKNDLSSSEPAIAEKLLSQISNHWSDNN
jgi:arylsulfatase A-like enzyme